jgi:tetratricopeptide (TPR) repeat protein
MNRIAPLALVALLAAAVPLAAQEPVPLTIDAVLVKPDELPETIRLVEGMPCVSPQPRTYYEMFDPEKRAGDRPGPDLLKALEPRAKRFQALAAEKGVPGSVFLFEFADADLELARGFFPSYLWGERASRSTKHPEELIVHGNLVWILSFPRGDPAAEWYKERLRKKYRVPALRWRSDIFPLFRKVVAAYRGDDADAGIRVLEENAAAAHGWAFGQYFLGEFAVRKQDWSKAERGYRRALELHDTLEDPLEETIVWASIDGLGMALLFQRKLNDAATALARAKELGLRHGPQQMAKSAYNLACAYALLERWPDTLAALKEAIKGDPKYRLQARTDEDLAEARKREEFQELLREPAKAPEAPEDE